MSSPGSPFNFHFSDDEFGFEREREEEKEERRKKRKKRKKKKKINPTVTFLLPPGTCRQQSGRCDLQ